MLKDKHIASDSKWDNCIRILAQDNRWKVILQISEKKKLFNEFIQELKKMERDESRMRTERSREAFFKMLEELNINNSDIKFHKVCHQFVGDSRWKSLDEKDRENIFQDYLDSLYEKEREEGRMKRKLLNDQFKAKLL